MGRLAQAGKDALDIVKGWGEYVDAYLAIGVLVAGLLAIVGFFLPVFVPIGLFVSLVASVLAYLLLKSALPPQVTLPNHFLTVVSEELDHKVYPDRRSQYRKLRFRAHRDTEYFWIRGGWTGSGPMALSSTTHRLDGPVVGPAGGEFYRVWFQPALRKGEQSPVVELEYDLQDPRKTALPYVSVGYGFFRACQSVTLRVIFNSPPKKVTANVFSSLLNPLPDASDSLTPDSLTMDVRWPITRPDKTKVYLIRWE